MLEQETHEHVVEALLLERKVENVGLKKHAILVMPAPRSSLPCHRE